MGGRAGWLQVVVTAMGCARSLHPQTRQHTRVCLVQTHPSPPEQGLRAAVQPAPCSAREGRTCVHSCAARWVQVASARSAAHPRRLCADAHLLSSAWRPRLWPLSAPAADRGARLRRGGRPGGGRAAGGMHGLKLWSAGG